VGARSMRPTIAEGQRRLQFLREHGPSPYAFSPPAAAQSCRSNECGSTSGCQLLIAQLNSDLYSAIRARGAHLQLIRRTSSMRRRVAHGRFSTVAGGLRRVRVRDDHPGSAEIKRMYVTLMGRGKKIGAPCSRARARRARDRIERFVLEVGPRQAGGTASLRASGLRRVRAMGRVRRQGLEHLHGEDSKPKAER